MAKLLFQLNKTIFYVGLISFFTDLSSEMIVPVLPLFLTTVLHVQTTSIGLIEGIAESTASVLKLFSGWFSDRLGKRKPLMVFGYGVANLIKPFFGMTTTWGQVLGIRFIDRFGKGMRGAPRDALIADVSTKEERGRAYGFHKMMDTFGAALGPFAAFLILSASAGNYRLVFWASAIPGIVAFVIVLFVLKEKKGSTLQQRSLPKMRFRGMGAAFVRFTLIATLFAVGNSSDAFLILKSQQVGITAAWIPIAYLVYNLVFAFLAMPFGTWSDKIGRRPLLVVGYLLFAGIYFGFGLAQNAPEIWLLFVIYGLYSAMTDGVQKAFLADVVSKEERGTAMGTFNALTGIAALPASLLAGFLWQRYGSFSTFAASGVIAVVAAVLLLLFLPTRSLSEK